MNDLETLERLISVADALEAEVDQARWAVVAQIRNQDLELSAILDDLLPTPRAQATWMFRKLFRRDERPVDLYISGRESDLRNIAGTILYGNYL